MGEDLKEAQARASASVSHLPPAHAPGKSNIGDEKINAHV
jgi:hypothetical protein